MDWDHLRFVLAVSEAGGLSSAARTLNVDAGTVARRLDALEAALRCKLFHRSRRGLDPTPAGAKLLGHAQRIAAEIRALDLGLSSEDRGLAGPVVITATEAIAIGLLMPALPSLRAAHPGIVPELVTDIRTLDLGRREADVALRLTRPQQGDLRVRLLGSVAYALYASAAYVQRRGVPDATARFAGHDVIDWPLDYTVIAQVPWLRNVASKATIVLRSGSAVTRRAAAAEGLGIALLPCLIADGDARLARIAAAPAPAQELWLATHRDLARMARVRVVLDFLVTTARRARPVLLGRLR